MVNNVVADNAATLGSGLFIWESSLQLLHTTIARNRDGDGRGVYVANNSGVVMTNSILVGHVVGSYVDDDSSASLDATLWGSGVWANGDDWSGSGIISTANDLGGDPAFVDPDNGDYHIGPGSAAIDAGVDAGVTTDIDGETRPFGAGYDIGADEWVAR